MSAVQCSAAPIEGSIRCAPTAGNAGENSGDTHVDNTVKSNQNTGVDASDDRAEKASDADSTAADAAAGKSTTHDEAGGSVAMKTKTAIRLKKLNSTVRPFSAGPILKKRAQHRSKIGAGSDKGSDNEERETGMLTAGPQYLSGSASPPFRRSRSNNYLSNKRLAEKEKKFCELKKSLQDLSGSMDLPPLMGNEVAVQTRRGSATMFMRTEREQSDSRRGSNAEMLKMFSRIGVGNKLDVVRLKGREDEA